MGVPRFGYRAPGLLDVERGAGGGEAVSRRLIDRLVETAGVPLAETAAADGDGSQDPAALRSRAEQLPAWLRRGPACGQLLHAWEFCALFRRGLELPAGGGSGRGSSAGWSMAVRFLFHYDYYCDIRYLSL